VFPLYIYHQLLPWMGVHEKLALWPETMSKVGLYVNIDAIPIGCMYVEPLRAFPFSEKEVGHGAQGFYHL